MTVTLSKGGNVNLTKEAGPGGLTSVLLGLGWKPRTTTGAAFDLDANVVEVGTDGKVRSDDHFVFYGSSLRTKDNGLTSYRGKYNDGGMPTDPELAVIHSGDNTDGEGEGDDEQVRVNVTKVSADVDKIIFFVTIHEATERGQNFGQVADAFIRVVDEATGKELARYDLSEDAADKTVMIFGELYRHGTDWKFRAVGQGYATGLAGIAKDYGVNV